MSRTVRRTARSSVTGVGIDSVQVKRFARASKRFGRGFLGRLFTPRELDYCLAHADPYPSLAVRFAAKEAVLKALDARNLWRWKDMEVRRGASGRPDVSLTGKAAAFARRRRVRGFRVSLTHDTERATAFVVALGG